MADPKRSEEMKASLGLPSDFHTAPTGTPSASPAPAVTPEHKLGATMVDHLKGLLGIAGKEPVPNGGLSAAGADGGGHNAGRTTGAIEAMNSGIKDGSTP